MPIPSRLARPASAVTLACALVAALAVPAAPAFAGGDIVKCVGADGRVTLTDNQCSSGVSQVIVPAAMNTAPGEAPADAVPAPAPSEPAVRTVRAGLQKISLTVEPIQHDNWIAPRPRGKMFDRDAATLRAARNSLQALDEASASIRQQRLASN